MSIYNPDAWVIVELSGTLVKDRYHRILAGWFGGYASADHWKMSSGITRIIKKEHYWEIHNNSGSIYNCHPDFQKTTMLTQSVFDSYSKANNDEISMKLVDFNGIINLYETEN